MEEMPKKPDHKSAWNVKINLFIVILVLSFGFFHILDKTIRGTPFSIKMDLLNRLDFKETRVKVFMENIDNTCRMRKYLFRNTTIRDDTSFSDDKCISRNDTLDGVFSYFVDDNFVETTCQKKRITFSETKMSKVALASYPGSGNTWLRHLIESVSGIATGSRNCGVVNRTFIGECRVDNRHTIVIKTHGSGTKKKYDKVVLVLRNPFDALLAEFNRLHANKTGVASKETFQQNDPHEKPYDLAFSDITNTTVTLHWKSRNNDGSEQYFIVFRWEEEGLYIQFSDFIHGETSDYARNNFTYTLKHLDPTTHYKLKIATVSSESDPVFSETAVDFWTKGSPQKPKDLYVTDLTPDTVILHWTSGYDGGLPQTFIVLKWIPEADVYIQCSNRINDTSSPNHGAGIQFQHTLTHLQPDTNYKLKVVAENTLWEATLSDSYVEFSTRISAISHRDRNIKIIIGSTVGGVAIIPFLATLVYLLKYWRMRTSYKTMVHENKRTMKLNQTLPL